MEPRWVEVNDRMQQGYRYERTVPMGKEFDPEFAPELTPQEMLELGVFGGVYMRDCKDEFPKSWFAHAKFAPSTTYAHLKDINFFKVNASQSLSIWREKGWIHADDPRGWFQWYCRYYSGRRMPDEDRRQIRRWRLMVRHLAQVRNACRKQDYTCHTRQRQALLHWAYDSRKL